MAPDLGPGPMTLTTSASALWPLGASQFSQGFTKHARTADAFTVAGLGDDKHLSSMLPFKIPSQRSHAEGGSLDHALKIQLGFFGQEHPWEARTLANLAIAEGSLGNAARREGAP